MAEVQGRRSRNQNYPHSSTEAEAVGSHWSVAAHSRTCLLPYPVHLSHFRFHRRCACDLFFHLDHHVGPNPYRFPSALQAQVYILSEESIDEDALGVGSNIGRR